MRMKRIAVVALPLSILFVLFQNFTTDSDENNPEAEKFAAANNVAENKADCEFEGKPVEHGKRVTAYLAPYSLTKCKPLERVCIDGKLKGKGGFSSCKVAEWKNADRTCKIGNQIYRSYQYANLFVDNKVNPGTACISDSLTCLGPSFASYDPSHGQFNPAASKFRYGNCKIRDGEGKACNFQGRVIPDGEFLQTYAKPFARNCKSQEYYPVLCSDGQLLEQYMSNKWNSPADLDGSFGSCVEPKPGSEGQGCGDVPDGSFLAIKTGLKSGLRKDRCIYFAGMQCIQGTIVPPQADFHAIAVLGKLNYASRSKGGLIFPWLRTPDRSYFIEADCFDPNQNNDYPKERFVRDPKMTMEKARVSYRGNLLPFNARGETNMKGLFAVWDVANNTVTCERIENQTLETDPYDDTYVYIRVNGKLVKNNIGIGSDCSDAFLQTVHFDSPYGAANPFKNPFLTKNGATNNILNKSIRLESDRRE